MQVRYLIACLAMFAIAGCQRAPEQLDPSISLVSTLAEPTTADQFAQIEPYRIGPTDILRYSVLGIEGMEGELQVDAGGRIAIPIAGSIQAAGMTADEVTDDVREKLRAAYVRDPQVTVNLVKMQSQNVTVSGEVALPGIYPIQAEMSLTKAIAIAQGTGDSANSEEVVVLRTINGRKYLALFNLESIYSGAYPDPRIYANDVVIVGRDRSRQLIRDLVQVLPAFATPIFLLLRDE